MERLVVFSLISLDRKPSARLVPHVRLSTVFHGFRDHGVALNCGIEQKSLWAEYWEKQPYFKSQRGIDAHAVSAKIFGRHAIWGVFSPLQPGWRLEINTG
jgi:TPP-dependent pyruvate/acetoin dehydrogenase alpha subunit